MITVIIKKKNNQRLPGAWERLALPEDLLAALEAEVRGGPLASVMTFDPYGTADLGPEGLGRWIAALDALLKSGAALAEATRSQATRIASALEAARQHGHRVAIEGD
jgi:hypothetical protein